jgi:hypothetical protein
VRYVFKMGSQLCGSQDVFESSPWKSVTKHTKFPVKLSSAELHKKMEEQLERLRVQQTAEVQQIAPPAAADRNSQGRMQNATNHLANSMSSDAAFAAASAVPAAVPAATAAAAAAVGAHPPSSAAVGHKRKRDWAGDAQGVDNPGAPGVAANTATNNAAFAAPAAVFTATAAAAAAVGAHPLSSAAVGHKCKRDERDERDWVGGAHGVDNPGAPGVAANTATNNAGSVFASAQMAQAKMLAELQKLDREAGGGIEYSQYFDPLVKAGITNLLDLSGLDLEDLDEVHASFRGKPLKKKMFLRNVKTLSANAAVAATESELVCVFTQEAFIDRVRFKSQATRKLDPNFYERKMIQHWLMTKTKSPLTNQSLYGQDLALEAVR